jgi:DNA-binding NarL/FixJ family response regulator
MGSRTLPTERVSEAVVRGRSAFAAKAWAEACAHLSAADRDMPLGAADLERLATALRLTGSDAESDVWARAHQAFLAEGDDERAARCAVRIAIRLLLENEPARSGGWLARAQRLLDACGRDCVERGYVLLPEAIRAMFQGDNETSRATFARAAAVGERFGDRDLIMLARHGEGRALIRLGEVARGVTLLDEVMVAVTADDLSPIVVGDLYCSVIEGCHEIYDLRRSREWTAALARWCASQPDISPYRGSCMLRRAELMQLSGAWPDARDEAERARESLSRPPVNPAVGAALYRLAELHRLRGEAAEAEEGYREASRWGRDPHPGLALLRLAQGRVEAAAAAIRGVVAEARNPRARAADLAACVDIMLAAGDTGAAHAAAEELSRMAAVLGARLVGALAAQGMGAVLLAEQHPREALAALREASAAWRELEAPHDAARTRVLIGLAHRALGDEDTAGIELDAARHAFLALGAAPDVRRLDALSSGSRGDGPDRLTTRELQVLGLVATGRTNRAIAERLGISEKTVARHLSNIFAKLELSTRAAATAYAYQHALVRPPT